MTRGDTCPHPDDLLRDELGELPVHRSVTLRTHVAGCAACDARRAAWRQLADDLAAPPSTPKDERAFVAGLEAVVRAEPRISRAAAVERARDLSRWRRHAPALF